MKTIYNLDTLIKIRVKDKEIYEKIKYYPAVNGWWNKFRRWYKIGSNKPGLYYNGYYECGFFTKEELESGKFNDIIFLIENDIVYFCPTTTLYFADGHTTYQEFQTYQEADDWAKAIANKSINVQLIKSIDGTYEF